MVVLSVSLFRTLLHTHADAIVLSGALFPLVVRLTQRFTHAAQLGATQSRRARARDGTGSRTGDGTAWSPIEFRRRIIALSDVGASVIQLIHHFTFTRIPTWLPDDMAGVLRRAQLQAQVEAQTE